MKTSFPIGKPAEAEQKEEVRQKTYAGGTVVTQVGRESETFVKGQKLIREEKAAVPMAEAARIMANPKKFTIREGKVKVKVE